MKPLKIASMALLPLLIAATSFSQKKNTLTFSIGASLPVGSFASTSVAPDVSPGYASTGFFADALFQKNISRSHFAVGGLLGFNMNLFKINTVIEYYKKNNSNFSWSGRHSNWITIQAMPGVLYSTPLSAKANFKAGLFTGAAAAQSPSFTLTGVVPVAGFEGHAESIKKSAWAITIASRVTAGAQFETGKKTNLVIQAGYNYLKPTFNKIVQTYAQVTGPAGSPTQQYTASRREYSYTQNMSTVNIGAGLLLEL